MDYALATSLYLIALALRLVPLGFSPLPFNIDGFPLAKIADGMVASGSWRFDPADVNAYNQRMPAFSLLWAATVQLGGLHALRDLQWFLPIVTATTAVFGYLLGAKLSSHRGVAFASGLFLATFGSFLFLTSAIMKESLGLVVLPIAVLLFHGRRDPRQRGLALLLLLVLPFLHHLTTLMALGIVASLVVTTHFRAIAFGRFSFRDLALDLATGPLAGIPAAAYYAAVEMPFFREVTSGDDLALFLAIAVFLTFLLSRTWRTARLPAGRPITAPSARVFLVPGIAFAGLVLNAQRSVFAGANATQPLLLAVVVPAFAILAVFVVLGYHATRRTANRANDFLLAIFTAPVALILFGFLRGLDPLSQAIVYRAFDFMDFGFAVLAGIGLVLAASRARRPRAVAAALGALFLASLLATTPIAWDSQETLGVENVTTPQEFQALAVLASLGARNVTTDQRLADVAKWWFGYATDASLPMKLRDNEAIEGHDYALVLERWTTVGAQIHPAPNVVLNPDALETFLRSHEVVYTTGGVGDRMFIVRLAGPAILK